MIEHSAPPERAETTFTPKPAGLRCSHEQIKRLVEQVNTRTEHRQCANSVSLSLPLSISASCSTEARRITQFVSMHLSKGSAVHSALSVHHESHVSPGWDFFFNRLLFSNFVSSLPLVVYKPAPCTKLHWPRPGIHLILSSSLSFVCWFLCFAMGRRTLRATTPGRENYGGMLEQVRYFVL